jgi:hypothetical protein
MVRDITHTSCASVLSNSNLLSVFPSGGGGDMMLRYSQITTVCSFLHDLLISLIWRRPARKMFDPAEVLIDTVVFSQCLTYMAD